MAGVVTNTSPVIALDQIGQLQLLQSLFGEVFIPPAVAAEAAPSVPELPSWIVVRRLDQPIASSVLQPVFGRGETEALGLALEINAALFIVDDRPARRLAVRLGIPVVGTMGILLRAKQAGSVRAVRPLVERLLDLGFRLSPTMRDRVVRDAGEQD
jgi:predicted nucleic acid-binding protein